MSDQSTDVVLLEPSARGTEILKTGSDFGRTKVAEKCYNTVQKQVAEMPSTDVEIFSGKISDEQFNSGRPSYINAILIQSRGQLAPQACKKCRDSPERGPFTECRTMSTEFWAGCCGNCKWRDWGARCDGLVRAANSTTIEGSSRVEEVE